MKQFLPLLPLVVIAACSEADDARPVYDTAGVEKRTIEVAVSSAGIVEPIARVEVKSKASGEVLDVAVETGDEVQAGDLLVSIDPRIVRNRLAQSEAELTAAKSRREIAQTQQRRVESLVANKTLTQADLEQATLDLANAEAQVVAARVNVENARIAVDDTDIRAPIDGTILFKPVEVGQVISSPTQDFAGGTSLLQMADLSAVQIRSLVDETDIGKIRPGMPARVSVAAYPNQPFPGEVVKIEPQAVVEQNITMFAVLVSIQNPDGLLMPGMNAEVEVSVARSEDVMTIPVMALRTRRDLETTATILGRSVADITSELSRGEAGAARAGGPETITIRGNAVTLPEGVSAEAVRELMQKRRDGDNLTGEEQQLLRSVFQGMGRQGAGGARSDYRFGGEFWVVLDTPDRAIRKVRTGVTDLDNVEIVSGLDADDRVLILPSSHLLETQQDLQNFINRRVGGVPGIG